MIRLTHLVLLAAMVGCSEPTTGPTNAMSLDTDVFVGRDAIEMARRMWSVHAPHKLPILDAIASRMDAVSRQGRSGINADGFEEIITAHEIELMSGDIGVLTGTSEDANITHTAYWSVNNGPTNQSVRSSLWVSQALYTLHTTNCPGGMSISASSRHDADTGSEEDTKFSYAPNDTCGGPE